MSKGGSGAAAANVLLLRKNEDRRQETALREAFKVTWLSRQIDQDEQRSKCVAIIIFVNVLCCLTARLSSYDLLPNQNLQGIIKIECIRHLLPNENIYPLALGGRLLNSIAQESSFTFLWM